MAEKVAVNKNQILSDLMKSPHGKLAEYLPVGMLAAEREAEFLTRLIAYNRDNGQIRDSKVALPVIALTNKSLDPEYKENALAHLAMLVPRELLRSVRFAREIGSGTTAINRLVKRYLHAKEENFGKWQRLAVQHRNTLKELYAYCHVKPGSMARAILFERNYPKGSVFYEIENLKNMSPIEAAGVIIERKIPFLIAAGALQEKIKNPDLVLALIGRMSPAELMNNVKMLEKLGVKTVPALRAAFEEALGKAATSKKVASFKATVAAEAVEDETLKAKLRNVQERQIKEMKGPEGNWAILADKSGSMEQAIEVSRQVAATLAKVTKGNVYLVFFDTSPRLMDVSGKTYDEILKATRGVTAQGGTSIGCGLLALADKKVEIDGIAIVSDGGENSSPMFCPTYKAYSQAIGKEVPVYLYHTKGEPNVLGKNCKTYDVDLQEFDLTAGTVDHYALPGIINSMKTNRYSVLDDIMNTPLLTIEKVLGAEKEAVGV